jgi:flagellar basal-body rod protein FlgB
MIDALLTSPATRMLEQTLNFTEERHQVILANLANVSTPGYVQQDVSVAGFQKAMADAAERERASNTSDFAPASNEAADFYPGSSHVTVKTQATTTGMAFHDRGVRSMESLMGDLADNGMAHNMVTQLLKSRYDWVAKAIAMKP